MEPVVMVRIIYIMLNTMFRDGAQAMSVDAMCMDSACLDAWASIARHQTS